MDIDSLNKLDEDQLFITDKHIFFFGSVFSNFYKSNFSYSCFGESHQFFCSEQAFMWHKAKFFGDEQAAKKIIEERNRPNVCKSLGRKVKGYVDCQWAEFRQKAMEDVNYQKFTQNLDLKKFIMQHKFDSKIFVEASPYDSIWGICIPIGDPAIDDEANWKGQNLLGKSLTNVRNKILSENR